MKKSDRRFMAHSLLLSIVFAAAGMAIQLAHPRSAGAADECGAMSEFATQNTRFAEYDSANDADYKVGTIVRYTPDMGTEGLYRKTGTETGDPSATTNGWSAALAMTEYAGREIDCASGDSLTSSTDIAYTANDLAIVFSTSTVVSSISHTGTGAEIHWGDTAITRRTAGDAISLSNTGTDAVYITGLATVDAESGGDAIDVSSGGNIFIGFGTSASQRTLTGRGNNNSAIRATRSGTGNINIYVALNNARARQASGTQSATSAVVNLDAGTGTGQIVLDIFGSSAEVGAVTATTANAIRMVSANTGTGDAANQIRLTDGSVFGSITAGGGNDRITVSGSGSLIGSVSLGGGADTLINNATSGGINLLTSGAFGAGADSFTNNGLWTFSSGTGQLVIAGLETFAQEGGTLTFGINFNNAIPTTAYLDLGSASTLTFSGGMVALSLGGGSSIPAVGTIPLITGTGISSSTDVSALSLAPAITTAAPDAALVVSGNTIQLRLNLPPCEDATTGQTPIILGAATTHLPCNAVRTAGIPISDDDTAIIYSPTAEVWQSPTFHRARYVAGDIFRVGDVIYQVDDDATTDELNALNARTSAPTEALAASLGLTRPDPETITSVPPQWTTTHRRSSNYVAGDIFRVDNVYYQVDDDATADQLTRLNALRFAPTTANFGTFGLNRYFTPFIRHTGSGGEISIAYNTGNIRKTFNSSDGAAVSIITGDDSKPIIRIGSFTAEEDDDAMTPAGTLDRATLNSVLPSPFDLITIANTDTAGAGNHGIFTSSDQDSDIAVGLRAFVSTAGQDAHAIYGLSASTSTHDGVVEIDVFAAQPTSYTPPIPDEEGYRKIQTSGARSHGIFGRSTGGKVDISLTVGIQAEGIVILTTGAGSHGIFGSTNVDSVALTLQALAQGEGARSIVTRGAGSHGIYALTDGGNATIRSSSGRQSGSISQTVITRGATSHAVFARVNGAAAIDILARDRYETRGTGSNAIRAVSRGAGASHTGMVKIEFREGRILTRAERATAIYAEKRGEGGRDIVDIDVFGGRGRGGGGIGGPETTITTLGGSAHGIHALANRNAGGAGIDIDIDGRNAGVIIRTSGANSHGILAELGTSSVNTPNGILDIAISNTIIAVSGGGSRGISANGGGMDLSITLGAASGSGVSRVSASGPSSAAIYIEPFVGTDSITVNVRNRATVCAGTFNALGECVFGASSFTAIEVAQQYGGTAGAPDPDIRISGSVHGAYVGNSVNVDDTVAVSSGGLWRLRGSNFGSGTGDTITNSGGTISIDHAANGDAQVSIGGLETFSHSNGQLRFRFDASGALPTTPLLNLGGARVSFTAGNIHFIDLVATAGNLPLSAGSSVPLLTATTLDSAIAAELTPASSPFFGGTFSIRDNTLYFNFGVPTISFCGGNFLTANNAAITPGVATRHLPCDDVVAAGITPMTDDAGNTQTLNNLAVVYSGVPAMWASGTAYEAGDIFGVGDDLVFQVDADATDDELALLNARAAAPTEALAMSLGITSIGATPFIRHTGDGGEIHITAGRIVKPHSNTLSAAVSVVSSAAQPIAITTAAGTTVSNQREISPPQFVAGQTYSLGDFIVGTGGLYMLFAGPATQMFSTELAFVGSSNVRLAMLSELPQNQHAIYAENTGNISLKIAGSTSAAQGAAIRARYTGGFSGARDRLIDIDIDGGTHTAQAADGRGLNVISVTVDNVEFPTLGITQRPLLPVEVDIASGATVGSRSRSSTSSPAIKIETRGRIRITNRGTIFGGIESLDSTEQGGASDVVINEGIWHLKGSTDLGRNGPVDRAPGGRPGAILDLGDMIENRGELVIRENDVFANLETFIQTSGTLRFVSSSPSTGGFLRLTGEVATFTAGTILLETGEALGTGDTIDLITWAGFSSLTTIERTALVGRLTSPVGALAISGTILQLTPSGNLICGQIPGTRTPTSPVLPGAATLQATCGSAEDNLYSSGISASVANLALIYNSPAAGTLFISNNGNGGVEIHVNQGTIAADSTQDATGAVRLAQGSGTDAIRLTTAAGTTVSHAGTSSGSHAITAAGSGDIFMEIAGSSSAMGASDAIRAFADGSSAIDVDIDGGTHTTTGTQGTTGDVVNLVGADGTIALDIASGAIVGASDGVSRRAIRFVTMGATTSTNAGAVYGAFVGAAGADSFTNSGIFAGTFTTNAGGDAISNSGTMTIASDADFGDDADSLINTGILAFDYAANTETIDLTALETFTQTSGTLRFIVDSSSLPTSGTAALLHFPAQGTSGLTFTDGVVELIPQGGGAFPANNVVIDLISSDSTRLLPSDIATTLTLGVGVLGALSRSSDGTRLIFTSDASTFCGTNRHTIIQDPTDGIAAFRVVCDDVQTAGIAISEDNLAILYAAAVDAGTATPFIRHTGAGGEIHIRSGSDPIAKPAGTDGAAVSVINAGADAIAITTASDTSVSNADADAGNHGIHASGGGNVFMDIAGSTSAQGMSDAIRANATGSSAIDIDIDGGTHTTTGTQGSSSAVVNLIGGEGTITLDIAAGATVGSSSALTRRAVRLVTSGATTSTNAGNLYGAFEGGEGADSFTNSGVFSGSFVGNGGGDRFVNRGTFTGFFNTEGGASDMIVNAAGATMTLNASSAFGGDIAPYMASDTFRVGSMGYRVNSGISGDDLTALNELMTAPTSAPAGTVQIFTRQGVAAFVPNRSYSTGDRFILSNQLLQVSTDFSSSVTRVGFYTSSNIATILPSIAGPISGLTEWGTDFAAGDSFTNSGDLIIDHAANGDAQISLTNLQSFTSTTGKLRFVLDFTNALPSDALLNLGGATLSFGAATTLELVDSNDPAGSIPTTGRILFIEATNLTSAAGFSFMDFDLFVENNILQADLTRLCGVATTARAPVSPGAATRELTCGTAQSAGIDIASNGLAFIYDASTGATPFLRHTGMNGEIHVNAGTITKTGTQSDGAAVSVIASTGGTIRMITASGTTISNTDTDTGNGGIRAEQPSGDIFLEIAGDVSTVGAFGSNAVAALIQAVGDTGATTATGNISVSVSGDTSTTGATAAAIIASTNGVGNIAVDITGGTHSASGAQTNAFISDPWGGVRLVANNGGQITLDIAASATVEATGTATRAIRLSSSNTTATTARTIGAGNWMGSRITNYGTITGELSGQGGGNILFENRGSIAGAVNLGGGNDEIRTLAASTITGAVDLGAGANEINHAGTITGAITGGSGNDEIITAAGSIITGNLMLGDGANDVTNAGTITGSLTTGSGADDLTNSGTFTGDLAMGDGLNRIINSGTLTINDDSSFGTGTDSINNTGILVIDYATETDQVAITGLETFTLASGTLRFRLDTSSLPSVSSTNALLGLGSATVALGTATLAIEDSRSGGTLPTTGIVPLISASAIASDAADSLTFGNGRLFVMNNILQAEFLPIICDGFPVTRVRAGNGAATRERTCSDSGGYSGGLSTSLTNLALLHTSTGTTGFIRLSGTGSEIHLNAGTVSATTGTGVSISISGSSNENILITTASGTSVSNAGLGSNEDAIRGVISSGSGNVYMEIAGSSTATGVDPTDAIAAVQLGTGEVHVDINGGTHSASGRQGGSADGTIHLSSESGQATLDIASGATVQITGLATRAIYVLSTNTATAATRTIGTSAWTGNRITNRGAITGNLVFDGNTGEELFENHGAVTGDVNMVGGNDELQTADGSSITGDIDLGAGNDILVNAGEIDGDVDMGAGNDEFTNSESGTFTGDLTGGAGTDTFTNSGTFAGDLTMGADADTVTNSGIMTLSADSDFGAAADSFTNSAGATLTIDHDANGNAQINLANLETFTFSGGSLRFVYDFGSNSGNALTPSGTTALLHLGGGSALGGGGNFAAGTISVTASSDSTRPEADGFVIPLIALTNSGGLTNTNIADLTSMDGELAVQSGVLVITLARFLNEVCGRELTDRTPTMGRPSDSEVVCDSVQPDGVSFSGSLVSFSYAAPAAGTPFIRLSSNGGEIHILAGAGAIVKTSAQSDGSAVSLATLGVDLIRITTAAGTVVRNTDATGSRNHGVSASGGGSVFMTIAGDSSAASASSSAIAATAAGSGGVVDISITSGRHTAPGTTAAVVALRGNSGQQLLLNIGASATIRATAATTRAISLSSSNAAEPVARAIGTGMPWMGNRALNSGMVFGDFIGGAGNDLFENLGSFVGALNMGGGDDEVQNAGMMTLNDNSDFGAGSADALVNTGTLTIDHAANDNQQVSIAGLERFAQESGVLRFVYDFSENDGALPASAQALLNIASANAELTAGEIDIVSASGVFVPFTGTLPLIVGSALPSEVPAALTSVFGALSISEGALQLELAPRISGASVQAYDALLQTGWYADRSFGLAMRDQACDPILDAEGDACLWGRGGARFTLHDPSGGAHYDEEAYALITGFHASRPNWIVTTAVSYERSNMEVSASGEDAKLDVWADRYLAGIRVGSNGAPLPASLDYDVQFRVGYTDYNVDYDFNNRAISARGDTSLLTMAASAGVEKRTVIGSDNPAVTSMFGEGLVVTRVELGLMSRGLRDFRDERGVGAGGGSLFVEDVGDTLGYLNSYLEVRVQRDLGWALVTPWFRMGANVFLGRPETVINGSLGETPLSAKGTLDRAILDVGFGMGYKSDSAELSLGYEGGLSFEGDTNVHNATFRFNYAF